MFTGPLEDRIALRELLDTYTAAVMVKDVEAWGETWAEDAYWALPEYPDLEGFSGREAIVEAQRGALDVYGLDDCTKPMIYFAHPGSIVVEGDKAHGHNFTIEIFQDPETKEELRVNGRYDDEYAKIDGRWYFTKRVYRTLHKTT